MGHRILFFIGLIPWALISGHFLRLFEIDKVAIDIIGTVLLFIQIIALIIWAISAMREAKQHKAKVQQMLDRIEEDNKNALDNFMKTIGEPKD
jgi:cbb3-type cytochrome oxidase subunit 3